MVGIVDNKEILDLECPFFPNTPNIIKRVL